MEKFCSFVFKLVSHAYIRALYILLVDGFSWPLRLILYCSCLLPVGLIKPFLVLFLSMGSLCLIIFIISLLNESFGSLVLSFLRVYSSPIYFALYGPRKSTLLAAAKIVGPTASKKSCRGRHKRWWAIDYGWWDYYSCRSYWKKHKTWPSCF